MGTPQTSITNQLGNMQQQDATLSQIGDQNQQLQNLATNGSPLVQAQLQSQMQGATNNNIKNATGVMANAKGINSAMAAREAGYNAANTQQQASNQLAQTGAQSQLEAQMAGQNILSNNLNSQYANQTSTYNQQNALNQQNAQFGATQGLAIAKGIGSFLGGGMSALAGAGGGGGGAAALAANGGMVQQMADGGDASSPDDTSVSQPATIGNPYGQVAAFMQNLDTSKGPASQGGKMMDNEFTTLGKGVGGLFNSFGSSGSDMTSAPQSSPTPDDASLQEQFAKGGKAKKKIPAMVSPGETYLKPNQVKQVAKGANPLKVGEHIPGKPKVPGNSYANDVVPKKLDAGGVVIPNSVMQSSDPAHNAYKFVQAVMAKNRSKGK